MLDDHGVGRIAFLDGSDDPPHVPPLNYAVRDHALVMRTRRGSLLDTTAGLSAGGARVRQVRLAPRIVTGRRIFVG